jgi:hypothetical protein
MGNQAKVEPAGQHILDGMDRIILAAIEPKQRLGARP